ncbi:hypothetical protein D3C76_1673600 [compost metagenome]
MVVRQRGTGFHQQTDGGGCRIPDRYLLFFENAVPALGVELETFDHTGHAQQQRRNDAV